MDEEGERPLPVEDGLHLKEFMVGSHFFNYDSMVVLTHFKGHGMGGYGGSLKNIAIGCASGATDKSRSTTCCRTATGRRANPSWREAITAHFGPHIVFINVMRRMSIDCDCAGTAASTPTLPDLGILASTDLVAIDQASIDIVYAMPDFMKHSLVNRIESRKGLRQLSAMKELGMGTGEYRIVRVLDKKPGQRPLEDGTDEA